MTCLARASLLALSTLLAHCVDDENVDSSDATTAADSSSTRDGSTQIDDVSSSEPRFEAVSGWLHLTEQRSSDSDDTYPRTLLKFYDATPAFLAERDRVGECRLLTLESTFCDPACAWNEVCVASRCVPFPRGLDVGTVTITGRDTATFAPIADSDNFYAATSEYPDDLFVTGSDLTVSATGGELEAFTLSARGPALLDTPLRTLEADRSIAVGEDYTVTWTPAEPASRVRLTLHPHGPHGIVEAAVIECDSPDDGSITVPGSFFADFVAGWGGCGECPQSTLTRYHRDAKTIDGQRIELVVGSEVVFFLDYQR